MPQHEPTNPPAADEPNPLPIYLAERVAELPEKVLDDVQRINSFFAQAEKLVVDLTSECFEREAALIGIAMARSCAVAAIYADFMLEAADDA